MKSNRWHLLIPAAAAATLIALAAATPAQAATGAAAPKRPTVTLIPAFDKDLPLSGAQLHATAKPGTVTPMASWVCSIYASDPTKFANTIEGEGFQSCAGSGWAPQNVRATLQKYKGFGFWNNLTRVEWGYTTIDFIDVNFIYDCSGLGTQTYRVVTDGYAVGGLYSSSVQSLNYLRVSC